MLDETHSGSILFACVDNSYLVLGVGVKSKRFDPDSSLPTIRVADRASRCKGWLKSMRDDFGKNDTVQKTKT